jgi:hypothetical protein
MHVPRNPVIRLLTLALVLPALALLGSGPAQATPTQPSTPVQAIGWGNGSAPADLLTSASQGYWSGVGVKTNGDVITWGTTFPDSARPLTPPASLAGKTITAVSAGYLHDLALDSTGHITAWGRLSENGSSSADGEDPAPPSSFDDKTFTAIAAGGGHSLALTDDGKILGWGLDEGGALDVPASLDNETITQIGTGYYDSYAIDADGDLTTWGYVGAVPDEYADTKFVAASISDMSILALTTDGELVGWGTNYSGELNIPADLTGKTITAFALGTNHGLAATSDGDVIGWGNDERSQTTIPDALTDRKVIDLQASRYSSLALTAALDVTTAPVLTGTPTVDQALTVTPGSYTDTPDSIGYAWTVDDEAVGDDSESYTPSPEDVGKSIKVSVTASKSGYVGATTAVSGSGTVAAADFSDGVTASISGVLKVGETLTAQPGTPAPTPDSYTYEWYADGSPISGADGATMTLTPAERHTSITVRITAQRSGYVDSTDDSDGSADVATELAPGLTLASTRPTLRLGQSSILSWSSVDATTVTASGSWTGAKSASGSATVKPTSTGTATYILSAVNDNGTTTAQVALPVALPPKSLGVAAPHGGQVGRSVIVKASGLARSEAYTISIGGKLVKSGRASSTGSVAVRATVPSTLKTGRYVVRVTGVLKDRTGYDTMTVTRPLSIQFAKASIRASDKQTVTIRNLLPGEKVKVVYNGDTISKTSARANSSGVYTQKFNVDIYWGSRTLRATGSFDGRHTSKQFTVVNRCPGGGYYCS